MRRLPIIALVLVLSAPGPAVVHACTTFCLRDGAHVVFGRNYDFGIGDGLVIVNKRNVAKTSAIGEHPARWTSRYGSVTFNQFGREFPTGGINEKGLTVELMMLHGSRYPAADQRPTVGVLEWIQYQLDVRASVAELVAAAGDVRIQGDTPLHYLVADPTGAVAAIEFLDGNMVIHSGDSLPVPVLANDRYEPSLEYLRSHAGAAGRSSLDRFTHAAELVAGYAGDRTRPMVDYSFDVLDEVSQGEQTRWSIVYDLTDMVVRFRTQAHRPVRSFRVAAFDFSCSAPVRTLDVNAPLEGDVTDRFVDYTPEANLSLVKGSYARTPFLVGVPPDVVTRMGSHAETTRCLP